MKFILQNSGEKIINDVTNSVVYPLTGNRHTVSIKPETKFWRFGLRFSTNPRGERSFPHNNRYNNDNVKHLEINTGIWDEVEWLHPNVIKLQQYKIEKTDGVYSESNKYTILSGVRHRKSGAPCQLIT